MNLGQAINAELVREGLRTATRPVAPAPLPPMGAVKHVADMSSGGSLSVKPREEQLPDGFPRKRVLEVLHAAARRLSAAEIFDLADELELGQVNAALAALRAAGEVDRVDASGKHFYAVTGRFAASPAPSPAPARAPASPTAVVDARRILALLGKAGDGLTQGDIRRALGAEGPANVGAYLADLRLAGDIVQEQGRKPHRYTITDRGRARLP